MLSGRDVLGHLNATVQEMREAIQQLDDKLQAASNRIAQNHQKQAKVLKRLAVLRLDAITSGEINRRLNAADRKVEALLTERSSALAALNERVVSGEQALKNVEAKRASLHDEVDEAATVLAERETEVQAALEADSVFQIQLQRAREADAIAVSAADKATTALEDRKEKGKPYEDDELFNYLWRRGYGASEYRANPLIKTLDTWVARLCGYSDARSNYWMLLEIPKRFKTTCGSCAYDC